MRVGRLGRHLEGRVKGRRSRVVTSARPTGRRGSLRSHLNQRVHRLTEAALRQAQLWRPQPSPTQRIAITTASSDATTTASSTASAASSAASASNASTSVGWPRWRAGRAFRACHVIGGVGGGVLEVGGGVLEMGGWVLEVGGCARRSSTWPVACAVASGRESGGREAPSAAVQMRMDDAVLQQGSWDARLIVLECCLSERLGGSPRRATARGPE